MGLFSACSVNKFVKTELYFGLSHPQTKNIIPETDWQTFVDTCVSPRFPDGLTVLSGAGQWKNQNSNLIDKEPSRVLVLLYPRKDLKIKSEQIKIIQKNFCTRFEQQAVMRVDTRAKVEF